MDAVCIHLLMDVSMNSYLLYAMKMWSYILATIVNVYAHKCTFVFFFRTFSIGKLADKELGSIHLSVCPSVTQMKSNQMCSHHDCQDSLVFFMQSKLFGPTWTWWIHDQKSLLDCYNIVNKRKVKGTSRGLETVDSNMNDSYYKNVICPGTMC